jgi:hypothetical protein
MVRSIVGTSSHMVTCRTMEEVLAAADADSEDEPPMSRETADRVAAIFWAAGYGWDRTTGAIRRHLTTSHR